VTDILSDTFAPSHRRKDNPTPATPKVCNGHKYKKSSDFEEKQGIQNYYDLVIDV